MNVVQTSIIKANEAKLRMSYEKAVETGKLFITFSLYEFFHVCSCRENFYNNIMD